jgi:hypothetical protein
MVLPGMQALFGFQLVAVFNSSFSEKLTGSEQKTHLIAFALVAVAIALVMTPAAVHRHRPLEVSDRLVMMASRFVLASMLPLMAAIGLDSYLIARLILNSRVISAILSVGLILLFSVLWFLLPRLRRIHENK